MKAGCAIGEQHVGSTLGGGSNVRVGYIRGAIGEFSTVGGAVLVIVTVTWYLSRQKQLFV